MRRSPHDATFDCDVLMAGCICPEAECTNPLHPASKACTAAGFTLGGKQLMAGWKDQRCPSCQPSIVATVRAARKAAERAAERLR